MTYRRLIGNTYNHLQNYKTRSDLVMKHASSRDGDLKELALEYQHLSGRYQSLINDYISLMVEASKLEAENEFMIKLINNKDNNESN